MQKQQATYATRICDDGLALDEPLEAQTSSPRSTAAPFRTDDWAAQKRLRSAVRELRRPNPTTGTAPNRAVFSERRLDPPQDLFAQIENATTPTLSTYAPASFTGDAAPKHNTSGQVAAWLVVIAGVVTLAAGLGLIGWSLSTDQMLYWNYAIGLVSKTLKQDRARPQALMKLRRLGDFNFKPSMQLQSNFTSSVT